MAVALSLSVSSMLIANLLRAKELLETRGCNDSIASTLLANIKAFETLFENFDDELRSSNIHSFLELDSIVNEIILVTSALEKRRNSASPYSKICRILFARSLCEKLYSLLHRFNSVVSTLHLATSVQEQRRKRISETTNAYSYNQFMQKVDMKYGLCEKAELSSELMKLEGRLKVQSSETDPTVCSQGLSRNLETEIVSRARKFLENPENEGFTNRENKILHDLTSLVLLLEECETAKIRRSDLQLGEIIGKGGFGYVIKAQWGQLAVAVKVISSFMTVSISSETAVNFSNELQLWKEFDHPNIVKLYGTCFDDEQQLLCFVMELCERSLFELIHVDHSTSIRSECNTKSIFKDIASGLFYLHGKNIVHRDVKSKNVLLNFSGGFFQAKLCDFGMTLAKEETATVLMESVQGGTPAYIAPELLTTPSHLSSKSDIYSVGILLWEFIECSKPWDGETSNSIMLATIQGRRPKICRREEIPTWIYNLMEVCWNGDRALRPTAAQLVSILSEETPIVKVDNHSSSKLEAPTSTQENNPTVFSTDKKVENMAAKPILPERTYKEFPQEENNTVESVVIPVHDDDKKKQELIFPRKKTCSPISAKLLLCLVVGALAILAIVIAIVLTSQRNSQVNQTLERDKNDSASVELIGHRSEVSGLTSYFLSGGPYLISTSTDKSLKLWSIGSAEEQLSIEGHSDSINGVATYYDSNTADQMVVTGSSDLKIILRKATSGDIINTFFDSSKVYAIDTYYEPAFNSRFIISGNEAGIINFWNTATLSYVTQFFAHNQEILALSGYFEPSINTGFVVSGSSDGTIKIWNTFTGVVTYTISAVGKFKTLTTFRGSADTVNILVGTSDTAARVYCTCSGEIKATLHGHESGINAVAAYEGLNDEVLLVTGSEDATVKVWNESGQHLRTYVVAQGKVTAVTIFRDPASEELYVAAGISNGKIVIFNYAAA